MTYNFIYGDYQKFFEIYPEQTPYHYAYNSPLVWKDPSGLGSMMEDISAGHWVFEIIEGLNWSIDPYRQDKYIWTYIFISYASDAGAAEYTAGISGNFWRTLRDANTLYMAGGGGYPWAAKCYICLLFQVNA